MVSDPNADVNARNRACKYCGTIPFRKDKQYFKCTECNLVKHKDDMAWAGEQGLVICNHCWHGGTAVKKGAEYGC